MQSTEVLIAFTATALIMRISPGTSNLYVIPKAIAQGTKGGLVAAMGLALGSMVHVFATAPGLPAIFSHSSALYITIKLAGAAYRVYLAMCYWKSKASGESKNATQGN
jgi:threonine/homoserine/homoserine lactone efflux protein